MTLTTLRLSKTGQTVTYRAAGRGEPLILLHGVGLQSAAWTPQLTALQTAYHVIALDLPGHGGSAPLPRDSNLPDFVAWGRLVIDELGLGPVNLAGHSMGALIAAGLATQYPDLVRRVALLNGVFRRDSASRRAVEARAAQIVRGDIDIETPLARWFGQTPPERAAKAQVGAWLGAVDLEGYATAYAAFATGDATYADQFAKIDAPLLALTADGDPNSTPAMSDAMARAVSNGVCVVLNGHRHMANLTAAAEVNAHLLTWLKQPVPQKEMQ